MQSMVNELNALFKQKLSQYTVDLNRDASIKGWEFDFYKDEDTYPFHLFIDDKINLEDVKADIEDIIIKIIENDGQNVFSIVYGFTKSPFKKCIIAGGSPDFRR